MLMASLPIAVVMQRQSIAHRWADTVWSVAGVLCNPGGLPAMQTLTSAEAGTSGDTSSYLVSGLSLELYPDENEGYFENWAAPEPKVFVLWSMQEGRAMPVTASVSYGEGTRMIDSGDPTDGVPMPPDIHAWLTSYLQAHYHPQPRRGKHHG